MQRIILKSKIHRATVTGVDLHYEGSVTVDSRLLEAANIVPGEQVHVLNLNNGARFVTYAIAAPRGSGTLLLNGPAARLGMPGDLVTLLAYAVADDEELKGWKPLIVQVDKRNRPVKR